MLSSYTNYLSSLPVPIIFTPVFQNNFVKNSLIKQTTIILGSLFGKANDPAVLLSANIKYFDVVTNISHVLANNQALLTQFQEELITRFGTEISTSEDINTYVSNKLRLAIENTEVADDMDCDNNSVGTSSQIKYIANAFIKLAYFTKDKNDDKLQGDFILYVLRAMKLNSLEAKQLFPCILIQNRLATDYTQLFIDEVSQYKLRFDTLIGVLEVHIINSDDCFLYYLSLNVPRFMRYNVLK